MDSAWGQMKKAGTKFENIYESSTLKYTKK